MRILITIATNREFTPWRILRSFRVVPTAGYSIYESNIADVEVVVILTGMGPGNARRAINLTSLGAADLCIATGLAGGLKPECLPGDVLVARAVRSHEDDHFILSDEGLFRAAVECGAKAVGKFVSVENIATTGKEKARLGALADAVDMESFAIMSEMLGRGVPAVALRSVADPVEFDMPYDFEKAVGEHGRVRIARVLAQVVRAPRALPALIRLAFASRKAAGNLARFLERYVESFAVQKDRLAVVPQPLSR
jgi:nucleoside phosphorylase